MITTLRPTDCRRVTNSESLKNSIVEMLKEQGITEYGVWQDRDPLNSHLTRYTIVWDKPENEKGSN